MVIRNKCVLFNYSLRIRYICGATWPFCSRQRKRISLSLVSCLATYSAASIHFHFSIRHFPNSFPLAAIAAVKCLKHQRRTKIAFSLRLGYASLRWSTSSFCPFAVAVQNFFAFAVDGVLGILARDPASTTHPRRSFIMLPGPRRDERHAHLIMCIYSEINFYFGQKNKKNGKNRCKTKKFHVACGFALTISKSKTKTKTRKENGEWEKKQKTKMTHAHKSCAEKCAQMLPFVTREGPHPPPLTTASASPLGQSEACLIAPWGSSRKPLIKMRFLSPSPPAVPPSRLQLPAFAPALSY